MRQIEFRGIAAEYDERCTKSYRWQKAMNSGDSARVTKAVTRIFAGKDDYYAYALSVSDPLDYDEWKKERKGKDELDELDDSMDAMYELLAAVLDDAGQIAKN